MSLKSVSASKDRSGDYWDFQFTINQLPSTLGLPRFGQFPLQVLWKLIEGTRTKVYHFLGLRLGFSPGTGPGVAGDTFPTFRCPGTYQSSSRELSSLTRFGFVRIAMKLACDREKLANAFQYSAWLHKFMSGHIFGAELIAAAETRANRILSYFNTGCLRMAEGRRAEAIQAFEQAEELGKLWLGGGAGLLGVFCAKGETYLHRMRTDPEWPEWIPNADSQQ